MNSNQEQINDLDPKALHAILHVLKGLIMNCLDEQEMKFMDLIDKIRWFGFSKFLGQFSQPELKSQAEGEGAPLKGGSAGRGLDSRLLAGDSPLLSA